MRKKDHFIKYLIGRLSEAGVINNITMVGGRSTVHGWIRKGKLVPRFQPMNKYYVFNDEEIFEIIKEFSPGGKGWWDANKR